MRDLKFPDNNLRGLNEVKVYDKDMNLIKTVHAKRLEYKEGLKERRGQNKGKNGMAKQRAQSIITRKNKAKPKKPAPKKTKNLLFDW